MKKHYKIGTLGHTGVSRPATTASAIREAYNAKFKQGYLSPWKKRKNKL